MSVPCRITPVNIESWILPWDHDDVTKWKHFPGYWPFVRRIHRSLVNSPHKGQWRGVLMFSLSCAWINDWVNNREAGGLKRHRAHYDVIVMDINMSSIKWPLSFLHPMICVCYRWWNSGILRRATPSLSTARHMETLPSLVWHLTKREEGKPSLSITLPPS